MLSAGPHCQDVRTVSRLAAAAAARGWTVEVFLMGDGVLCAPLLAALPQAASPGSIAVTWCAHNARQRGIEAPPTGIAAGSQMDWARMVDEADRVCVFG